MQEQAELSAVKDILFTLKEITYTPERPRLKEPFTVKGKVELLKLPFVLPIWVIAKVTYPEEWWEEIIPIWGSPTIGESQTALGGDFEINFPRGFDREGEFILDVEVHAGPTFTVDKITIPPFPPAAREQVTFIVGGEVPPEEIGFREFRILSYSKNGGPPVTPPGVLELDIGDRCRVNIGLDHMDGAVTGEFYAAIWQKRPWDPHDEILHADKSFTVPSSPDWEPFEDYIDIVITSAISPSTEYGLYVKIMGITGGDIFTEYLANVITIVGVPEIPTSDLHLPDPGFEAELGTYDLGDKVPWSLVYQYKGKAQGGYLTISLGTGPIGTFWTKHTFPRVAVSFNEAMDWAPGEFSGTFTLPTTLEAGQTYSVRAKLETVDGKQETDTDWGVFDITAPPELETLEVRIDPVGAGYVTVSPTPAGGIQHNWLFSYDTMVYVTAHPNPGYVFESWSGEMTDTPAITAPVYPMTEHRLITAHFKEEVVVPPSDLYLPAPGFEATPGTYDIGDRVPWTMVYQYKGKAQGGWLTISLGTGTYPSFFTKYTFPRVAVSFEEAMDWTPSQLTGNITLPTTLELGQTYSVRAKLETADGVLETDTDWGVIKITEAPPVVPPKADIADWDFRAEGGTYAIGDRVPFSASYKYRGKRQSGQLVLELGTGVYPTFYSRVIYSPMAVDFEEAMDWESRRLEGTFLLTEGLEPGQTYSVRAKLETLVDRTQEIDTDWGVITIEEVLPPPGEYTLTIWVSPMAAGWVTKEPDKTRYSYGEIVKLTAHNAPGYSFQSWWVGDEFLSSGNPITFMVLSDRTITAYFL